MAHIVSVSQLRSNSKGIAFLNVREDAYGGIGVWGHMGNPTYLLTWERGFELIQFDNQAVADEWLKENAGEYTITKLEPK